MSLYPLRPAGMLSLNREQGIQTTKVRHHPILRSGGARLCRVRVWQLDQKPNFSEKIQVRVAS
jgi:hypothetical protein